MSWVTSSVSRAVPPGRDPHQGFYEVGDVGDPVFEQVADPGRPAREQFGGVAGLDVLREHRIPTSG